MNLQQTEKIEYIGNQHLERFDKYKEAINDLIAELQAKVKRMEDGDPYKVNADNIAYSFKRIQDLEAQLDLLSCMRIDASTDDYFKES